MARNTFRFQGDDIFFSFPFNQTISSEIKYISGARWNPSLKVWVVPLLTATEEIILDFIDRFNFQEKDDSLKEAKQKLTFKPIDYAHIEGKLSMLDLCFQPRDYQKESIAYGLKHKKFINGDDMGLGKTYVSVVTVELEKAFPCLVVTPASVKYNFAAEWTKYTGRTSVSVIESKETKKRKNNWDADVVIINYDILGKLVDNGRRSKTNPDKVLKDLELRFPELTSVNWKGVVLDEAHFLKNGKAARSKAAAKIVKDIPVRLLLTGTPVSSRPDEAINLFKLCDSFNYFAHDWLGFVQTYCNAKMTNFGWDTSGASNLIELNQKMRDSCYIRHEKGEVLRELPDVVKTILNVPLSNQKRYNDAMNDLETFLLGEGKDVDFDKGGEELQLFNTLRKLSIEGKLKAIEQYLKDWADGSTEKLIVFGHHREPLIHLANKFKCDLLIGGTTGKQKFDIVNKFKTSDQQFIFAGMDAVGTGTNGLQDNCSHGIVIELPWNPDKLDQTISRLHRSGQKFSTNINFLLNLDCFDKYLWEMLESKEAVSSAVIKGVDIESSKVGMKIVLENLKKDLEANKK